MRTLFIMEAPTMIWKLRQTSFSDVYEMFSLNESVIQPICVLLWDLNYLFAICNYSTAVVLIVMHFMKELLHGYNISCLFLPVFLM